MHDPIGFDTSGSFAGIKYECLFNSDRLGSADGLIGAGGLPVAGSGRPVRPWTVGIFAVPWREEVPLLFTVQSHSCRNPIPKISKFSFWKFAELERRFTEFRSYLSKIEANWNDRSQKKIKSQNKNWKLKIFSKLKRNLQKSYHFSKETQLNQLNPTNGSKSKSFVKIVFKK